MTTLVKPTWSTCPTCNKHFKVTPCREHIIHCTRPCYQKSLELDPDQIKRIARSGVTRRHAANQLDMPYQTFIRKLKAQGLNNLFPGRGKYNRYYKEASK